MTSLLERIDATRRSSAELETSFPGRFIKSRLVEWKSDYKARAGTDIVLLTGKKRQAIKPLGSRLVNSSIRVEINHIEQNGRPATENDRYTLGFKAGKLCMIELRDRAGHKFGWEGKNIEASPGDAKPIHKLGEGVEEIGPDQMMASVSQLLVKLASNRADGLGATAPTA